MNSDKNIEEINFKIKQLELIKLKKENKNYGFFSPTLVTLLVALISLLGSLIANFNQKSNQLELERQKFESDLIITAVKTNDIKSSRDNLKFLIEAGLIKSNSIQLSRILSDTSMPLLNFPSYTKLNPIYSLNGTIIPPLKIKSKDIKVTIWPHSTENKTITLKQTMNVNKDGKFKIANLEEINYVIEFADDAGLLKRFFYSPNLENPNDFKTFDLSN